MQADGPRPRRQLSSAFFEYGRFVERAARAAQLPSCSRGEGEPFRVLGHPARVRILELLRDGERSVGALQAELELDSGGTSQHLAALRRIGLVESRREGTSVFYRVPTSASSTCSRPAASIIARRLAEQQSILRELETP